MMWWYGLGPGWAGGFGIAFMIIFWIFIFALIFLAFRAFRGPMDDYHHQPEPRRPLQILQERYARGEIDKKEYDEKKEDLISSSKNH